MLETAARPRDLDANAAVRARVAVAATTPGPELTIVVPTRNEHDNILPVYDALWANLHGGFTLGLALMVPIGVEAVWSAMHGDRKALAMQWLGFALAAVLCACITPYGPESMLVTYRILSLGEALSSIGEWRPQDFSRLDAFECTLLLGLAFAFYRGVRLPPLRIVLLLGL